MKATVELDNASASKRRLGNRLRALVLAGLLGTGLITYLQLAPRTEWIDATVAATPPGHLNVPVAVDSSRPSSAALDLAAMRRQAVEAHQAAIAQHLLEPRDPDWADASAQRLREFLATLSTHGEYRVTSVDCRTTSCVAELSFASFEVARQAWRSVLEAMNPIDCGTEITLEDPKRGVASHAVSVVYDCADRRARVAASEK